MVTETGADGTLDLTKADRLKPHDQLLTSRLGSDMVLLELVNGRYFGLDDVGTTIFELLREEQSLGEVHSKLVELYDCDAEELWQDLQAFLSDLLSRRLLYRVA